MIKAIRIVHGLDLLDYKTYKRYLHLEQKKHIQKLIKNSEYASNQIIDSAKMSQIMLITEILKTIRLMIIISYVSYFSGLIWYVVSELTFLRSQDSEGANDQEFFVHEYGLAENSDNFENAIALAYFAFTTLSTVGLGDFHPLSN